MIILRRILFYNKGNGVLILMKYIWAGLIIIGISIAALLGNLKELNDMFFDVCDEAVFFTIGLSGIMAVWSGIMNIAKGSGLINSISKAATPLLRFLFPKERNEETLSFMVMNMVMNMFGAGNSATVFGIKAMKALDASNHHRKEASSTMCMFLVINMSSVQLIPLTVVKVRNDAGSIDSMDILIPTIVATFVSTIVGITVCKWFERRY